MDPKDLNLFSICDQFLFRIYLFIFFFEHSCSIFETNVTDLVIFIAKIF